MSDANEIAAQSPLLAPVIIAAGAFVVLVLRLLWDSFWEWWHGRQAHNNLVRALFAEIDFNTRDMEVFLSKSPKEDALKEKMSANPALVPHITDARHTHVYRSRIGELHSVKDETLSRIVHFYGMLEKIKVQIDAVNYPSYNTLSVEGRMNAVMVIVRSSKLAEAFGKDLLRDMARDYAKLSLKRFDRPEISVPSAVETDSEA